MKEPTTRMMVKALRHRIPHMWASHMAEELEKPRRLLLSNGEEVDWPGRKVSRERIRQILLSEELPTSFRDCDCEYCRKRNQTSFHSSKEQ